MSEKPLAELSPRDIESQLNLKAGLTRGIPELAVEVRRRLEQGERDRQALDEIRALRLNPYCMTPSPEQEVSRAWDAAQVNTILQRAARAEGKHE